MCDFEKEIYVSFVSYANDTVECWFIGVFKN